MAGNPSQKHWAFYNVSNASRSNNRLGFVQVPKRVRQQIAADEREVIREKQEDMRKETQKSGKPPGRNHPGWMSLQEFCKSFHETGLYPV